MSAKKQHVVNNGGLGSAYFVAMIGAAIYYVGVADGLWEIIVALFKALFWPGFFVYEVLKFIGA